MASLPVHVLPRDSERLKALANEAGQSRIWAGIHFPTDVRVGLALGQSVAQKTMERVQGDVLP